MKFTILPLLALAGSTVAMPAGQPQAAPPGIVDPTILRRTAGKNATHPAKNATVKAQPVFRIQNLDYTLEPLSKKSLQSNLTFDVAYGAKASEASAFTTCTLSWSVKNKKKEYKSAKYVSAYHRPFENPGLILPAGLVQQQHRRQGREQAIRKDRGLASLQRQGLQRHQEGQLRWRVPVQGRQQGRRQG